MADPQGQCHFTNLTNVIRWEMTLSAGIEPSACIIEAVAKTDWVDGFLRYGPLSFQYANESILFQNCMMDHATVSHQENSDFEYIWRLVVLDRRWRWQYGEISGEYNVLLPEGSVDPDTEKTPKELMEIILAVMGEEDYQIQEVPGDVRPYVYWDYTNPARALASLAEQCGCVITLGLDDHVWIWKLNSGPPIPNFVASQKHLPLPVNAMVRPEFIKVVGPPVVVQSALKLEAVGVDQDGKIRKINELSYKPSEGWFTTSPWIFGRLSTTFFSYIERRSAYLSVFRWYRIISQPGGSLAIPGVNAEVTDVRQYLPLGDKTINATAHAVWWGDSDTASIPNDYGEIGKPFITGTFWSQGLRNENVAIPSISPSFETLGYLYNGEYDIDREQGIVRFANPVFQVTTSGKEEAELYLHITHSVQQSYRSSPARYGKERQLDRNILGVNLAGTRVVYRPDLQEKIVLVYVRSGQSGFIGISRVRSNRRDLEAKAKEYLDRLEWEYNAVPQDSMEYASLMKIPLSGLVKQVRWSGGRNRETLTRVSIYKEFDIFVPPPRERRRGQKLDGLLEFQP